MAAIAAELRFYKLFAKKMLKRKLQDLTVCCTYKVDFLHQKAHSSKEFRRQYRVLEEIGRGGFGVVYKAERISDNQPVAVKYVQHKHVREWTMTSNQLIPSELCHLESCKDIPGVIGLIDWFANSKGFIIVMERPADCMDLFDLVSTYGRLDEDTARGIFTQVVDTVCAMYAKHGIVHRDIKDENLIVDMTTGEVKLVDFGAAAPAEKAMRKEFQGTRSYCPPEWFRQLQYLPVEATSWSLGVLLYILVTGNLPFRNEIQICLGRLNFPSYLSKDCVHLIRRCLSTFPGHRAGLVEVKQHSWMNVEMSLHEDTFQEVLDRTLGRRGADRSDRTPRRRGHEGRESSEEERQINDVILVDEQRIEEKSPSPVVPDDCSSMHTCAESIEPATVVIPRLNSRYDNISASSLADYMSLASVDTRGDSVSMATTNNYYHSANELNDGDDTEEDCSAFFDFSQPIPPVKSASAYNLNKNRKKMGLMARSYDRELGTVPESDGLNTVLNSVMTSSVTSTTSTVDEPTVYELSPPTNEATPIRRTSLVSPKKTIAPFRRTSLLSSNDVISSSKCVSAVSSSDALSPPLSRVRPLVMLRPQDTPPKIHLGVYAQSAKAS